MKSTRKLAVRAAFLSLVVACAPAGPAAIAYGADSCAFCRMLISDRRFGAAILTLHGRTVKFDSIECLLAYVDQDSTKHDVASVWVSNFIQSWGDLR